MLKNKPFWIALGLLAVYLLGGYLLGPQILQPRLQEYVRNETGRELEMASLRFDPITLSLVLEQVNLAGSDQSLWPGIGLGADEIHIRFNFWRMRPAISDLLLVAPVVQLDVGREQAYPFVTRYQEWQAGKPANTAGRGVEVAQWRLEAGRLARASRDDSGDQQLLLAGVQLQAAKVNAAGLRDFKLAFETGSGSAVQASGWLNLAVAGASGSFEWSQDAATAGPSKDWQATGKFQAEIHQDQLRFTLHESQLRAGSYAPCWSKNLLCVEIAPLEATFEARGLVTTAGVGWQGVTAELQAFSLHSRLGRSSVELSGPWSYSGGTIVVQRSPQLTSDLAHPGSGGFDISLEARGGNALSVTGVFNPADAQATFQFKVAGENQLQGELRLQDFAAQQAQASFSQLELQLANPAASLALHFMDTHLSGQLLADELGLQLLANQDDTGLELMAQISLAGLGLAESPAPVPGQVWDPEWLLALWQNPQRQVELELPALVVDGSTGDSLQGLLEPPVLGLLQESMEDPFRTLSRLVDTPADSLDSISFAAGNAALDSQSTASLQALAEALLQRPGLGLEAWPVYDPLIDLRALQTEQVRTHIALAGAAELSFQSGAEPTDFTDAVVHSVIDEFARQRLPAAVLAGFFEHFGVADVDQGIVPEGDIAAYYQALFELLVEYAEIPQGALASLARYRAQAVQEGLAKQGVPRSRLRTAGEAQVAEARVEGVPMSLQLFLWRAEGMPQEGDQEPDSGAEALMETVPGPSMGPGTGAEHWH